MKYLRWSKVARIAGLTLLFLRLGTAPAAAQQQGPRLTIHQIDNSIFPQVTAHLTITDARGLPVRGIEAGQFLVSEDNQTVPDFNLTETSDTDQPISVVLALDTSESIRTGSETALADIQQAATSFVEGLKDADLVGVVVFSNSAQTRVPLFTRHAEAIDEIKQLKPAGQTALYEALVTSTLLLKDLPPGRKAVIVLTDGADSGTSSYSLSDVIDTATRWGIPIYPIGFGAVDDAALTRIADLTGGHKQISPDTQKLQEEFAAVLETLRREYVVTYISRFPADSAQHKLAINVTYQNAQFGNTGSFTAQPNPIFVSLKGLQPGQAIGGKVALTPEIKPGNAVASVEYSLDGQPLQTVSAKPFDYEWDTAAVAEGEHSLKVAVTDVAGNRGSQDLKVMVRPPIKVTWLSPTDQSEISGITQKVAVVVDSLEPVKSVEFSVDTVVIQTMTAPPYEFDWSLLGVASGVHNLKVKVTDAKGQVAEQTVRAVSAPSWFAAIAALLVVIVLGVVVLSFAVRRRRDALSAVPPVASPSTEQAVLILMSGDQVGERWPITAAGLRIGRSPDNDLVLNDPDVSREHAEIRQVSSEFIFYNLKGENPSFVNDQPVDSQATLLQGSKIQIGATTFRFQINR